MGMIKRISVTGTCIVLSLFTSMSFVGYKKSKENKITKFTDDPLKNTLVVSIDGSDDVCLVQQITVNNDDLLFCVVHYHYYDPIANIEYVSKRSTCYDEDAVRMKSIEIVGPIQEFMTSEEIVKLNNGNLTRKEKVSLLAKIRKKAKDKLSLINVEKEIEDSHLLSTKAKR